MPLLSVEIKSSMLSAVMLSVIIPSVAASGLIVHSPDVAFPARQTCDLRVIGLQSDSAGNPYLRERLRTVDFLVQTALFIKNLIYPFLQHKPP